MGNYEKILRAFFGAFERKLDIATKSMNDLGYKVKYWQVEKTDNHAFASNVRIYNDSADFSLTFCDLGAFCVIYQIDDECYMIQNEEIKKLFGEPKHKAEDMIKFISDFLKIFDING